MITRRTDEAPEVDEDVVADASDSDEDDQDFPPQVKGLKVKYNFILPLYR